MWSFIYNNVWMIAVFSQLVCPAVSQSTPRVTFHQLRLRLWYSTTGSQRFLTTVSTEAISRPPSDTIIGSDLWTSELYATRLTDHLKLIIDDQLLDSDQASLPLVPGRTLSFSSDVRVNIATLGAFTHFCVKLYKNPAASPDYIFSYRNSDHITACLAINRVGSGYTVQQPPQQHRQRPEVRLGSYNVGYQYEMSISSSGASSQYITRVVVDGTTQPDSRSVNAYNAWQLRLFLNARRDGSGRSLTLTSQLLDANQASKFVGPNQRFYFVANRRVSLYNYGQGTSFPYVCAELATTSSSRYPLNFNGRQSAVSCSLIEQAPEKVRISSYDAEIRFSRPNPNLRIAVAHVTYVVGFNMSSSVTGRSLWQLKMFASENEDGTGRNRSVSEQILAPNQMSADARAGGQFTLQTGNRFDIEGLGADNGLPYMCIAFTKHQRSPIDICYLGDSVITSCELIPQEILQLPDPRVLVREARMLFSFNQTSGYSAMVHTTVKLYITFSRHSDDIEGGMPLWQLRLFASQNSDGIGYQRELASQLLDEEQTAFGVSPGAQLEFTGDKNINFTGIGRGTHFPYICASLEKNPDAEMELVWTRNAIVGCQALPRVRVLPPSQLQSSILLSSYNVGYQYETAISSSGRPSVYLTRVTVDATTQPTSQSVNSYNAWQLRLFLNSRQDGSGPGVIISNQLLDSNQASTSVGPNQQFSFEVNRRLNVDNYGPGTSYPYVCTELTTTSRSQYPLSVNGRRSAVVCRLIQQAIATREVRISSHDAEISFSRPNPNFPQAVAHVVYHVNFNMSSPTVTGRSLWQLKMFASENEDGTGRNQTVSEQILSPNEMSVAAIAGRPFTVRATERFDIHGLGGVNGLPYMCVAFTKNPLSPVDISFQGDSVITSCEPIPQEIVRLPNPRAIVSRSQVLFIFNQTSLYDPMVHTTVKHYVTFSGHSDTVEGTGPMWRLGLFASQNSVGTGYQRELASQLLDEEQMAFGVSPFEQLVFTGEKSINFTGIGSGTRLPFICVSLEKNPDAEMELLVGRKNVVVGCRTLPRFHVLPRPQEQSFIRLGFYNVGYRYETARSSLGRRSVYLTQVTVNATTQPTSQTVDTNNAWQLRLFLNAHRDGSGPSVLLSNQLLDSNQASTFVGPSQQFSFEAVTSHNVNNYGPGTAFPYVCAELTTTSLSPYPLKFNGRRSAVLCSLITQEAEEPAYPQAVIGSAIVEFSFNQTSPYDAAVATTVTYNITFSDHSDTIEGGTPLWQLRIFASQNPYATGYQRELASQLLDEQRASGVFPGEQLVLTSEKSINFNGIGPGTHFPFICASLEKNPDAEMELRSGIMNAVVRCLALPRVRVLPRPQQQSFILLRSYDVGYRYDTARFSPGMRSVYLARVTVNATTQPTSQTVDANNAWQLRLFLNSRLDGSGPRVILSDQLLDSNQTSTFVGPNQQFSFEADTRYNVDSFGLGTSFPYVCAELTTTSLSPYPLSFHGMRSAVSCGLITQVEPEQPGDPQAHVASSHIVFAFDRTSLYDAMVDTAVQYYITFSDDSDTIEGGTPLWQLRVFASEHSNATGYQRELASQLLDEEQRASGVFPGEQLVLTGEKSINFYGIGPGTHLPYICASLEKNPDAEMELLFGRMNAIFGCKVLPRVQVLPQPQQPSFILLRSYDVEYRYEAAVSPSGRTSVYLTGVTVNATTQPTSQTVDANNAWRLRLFLNSREDGSGPRALLSNQLLDSNQASTFVGPNQQFSLEADRRFDVDSYGPGTSYPYVCTELTTTSSSPYMLNFNGRRDVVTCSLMKQGFIPQVSDYPRLVNIMYSSAQLNFLEDTNPRDDMLPITVLYDVQFGINSEYIGGGRRRIWVMRLFTSQNVDGTGNRRGLSAQLLDDRSMMFGVTPGSYLRLEGETSVNTADLGAIHEYPYICASLETNPDAEVSLVFEENAHTFCQEIPSWLQEAPATTVAAGPRTPKAIVSSAGVRYTFLDTNTEDAIVNATIHYDVFFDILSGVIEGGMPLWSLRLFASENADGSGSQRLLSAQLLDEEDMMQGIGPGVHLQFLSERVINYNEIGDGTDYPYICTELRTNANVDVELFYRASSSAVICERLPSTQRVPDPPLPQQVPDPTVAQVPYPTVGAPMRQQFPVEQQHSRITLKQPDHTSDNVYATAQYVLMVSHPVDGHTDVVDNPHWQLRLFASQNEDGSGRTRLISPQILEDDQEYTAILPEVAISFTVRYRFGAEGLGSDTSLPYICSSLSAHPEADFDLLNGDGDAITMCSELFLEIAQGVSTCRIWGDPHQKTFDGYGYSFQDVGKYVAVETCEDGPQTVPRFRLLFETFRLRPSLPVSYIRGFQLEYGGVVYALNHPSEALVDGAAVTLPFRDDNNVSIQYAAPHQILTTGFGLVIRLDEGHNSDITLTDLFAGKVCGLCGNYDAIRGNECHYKNGSKMLQHNEDCKLEFVEEWKVAGADLPYPEHIKDFRPCDEGSPLMLEASSSCGILTDPTGPLASCHSHLSPDLYYENCVFDLCQLLPSALFLCGSVEAYIYECRLAAGQDVHVGDWRNHTSECEPKCPENMVFNARGSACPPTCADPDGSREDCPVSFLESCQCVHGMVLDGTRCVDRSSCGCKMRTGQYLSVGEEMMTSDCSEVCSCDEVDGLHCSPVICAENAVCDVKGGTRNCYCQEGFNGDGRQLCREQDHKTCRIYGDPHFLTFDDVFYSFQGGCLYTAVHTCKPLPAGAPNFRIVIKNERLIPEERYTYVTEVQLRISGKTYKLTYTGRASLDNVPLNDQLPYVDSETGILITSNQSNMHLETPFGVELTFSVDNALSIRLPTTYYGKVCGLCGNADGSNANDQMLPDGTLGKKLVFANSWSFGQCVPLDEPVESCREGSDEYAEAMDMCNDIIKKDGPFAHCHDYQDPLPFFQSCVFDLCSNLPDSELFCTSINQYLEACAEKGGRSDFDWKKDVPACAPVNCPEGYVPFKRSCYKLWRMRENFETSMSYCESEGGHLATITSRLENEFVSDLAERKRSWIGGVRNFSASFRVYQSSGADSYTFLPEQIPKGIGSVRFSVSAGSNAYIILSPTMEPGEHTPVYEIGIGTEGNGKNFIRRCIACPEEASERKRLLRAGKERRFYVNFHGGRVQMGRFKNREIELEFFDDDPFRVHYVGFKTVGEVGTWKFFENEMKWITSERWSFDNYRHGEPSNYNDLENCLETNFDSRVGAWNDHFCDYKKPFVCEI